MHYLVGVGEHTRVYDYMEMKECEVINEENIAESKVFLFFVFK